jgi:hypothetical protein
MAALYLDVIYEIDADIIILICLEIKNSPKGADVQIFPFQ